MHRFAKYINPCLFAIIAAIVFYSPASAQENGRRFPVRISYSELTGKDSGYAEVCLTMTIPIGTQLIAREAATAKALSVLQEIWGGSGGHEDVLGFTELTIPADVRRNISSLDGASFILAIIDAFGAIEDAGFSRFQSDVEITSSERVKAVTRSGEAVYGDAPRSFTWSFDPGLGEGDSGHENWIIASLVNYSAAVLSFRSELGRFPGSLAELRETHHLLIEPLNPYTSNPVKQVDGPSPGNIKYQYDDDNRVVLYTYIQVDDKTDVVRREINLYSTSGSFDLLYRQTAGMTEKDKQVARYIFQISQILNEYYYENLDLPYGIPQIEAEAFAYVSFPNPYAMRDVQQADSLAQILPGDYTYHRVSATSYYIVGYGSTGQPVLSVSKNFGPALL
ncbi:MAG: hypothetical protein ABIC40_01610 [bacterium]